MDSIGVDVGTSVVKAVRFDEQSELRAQAQQIVPVQRPDPVRAEQDMLEVLRAVQSVIREVAPAGGRVQQIAVTAQGDGCWLVDEAGQPTGPAMLWSDARAAGVVERWESDGVLDRAFAVTGSYGNAGLPHALLSWAQEQEPVLLERSAAALTCGSWLHRALTGRTVLDVSEACNPFLDAGTLAYSDELLHTLGLTELRRLLPPVVQGADRVGALTAEQAQVVGVIPGTPVVLAPYDVVCTATGVGAVTVGSAVAVLGTTLCVAAPSAGPALDRPPAGMALATGEGRWLLAYATLAGTEVLDWWARTLGCGSAAALAELSAGSTAGQTPLLLPYMSPAGERAPFRDPRARGAMIGLDFTHTPADLARAVLEGLTMAVRDCLEASGQQVDRLRVAGGGSRSDFWSQLLSDALQVPVERTAEEQTGALGAVLVGLTSLGLEPDLEHAVQRVVRPARTFEPQEEGLARLGRTWERFQGARERGAHLS